MGKMGSADLPEAAATRQENLYTVSQRCVVFVFHQANLCTTGIRQAARGVDVLPLPAKQIFCACSSVTDEKYTGNNMMDDKNGAKQTDDEYGIKKRDR
jgi:hypothetical protein